MVSGWRRGVPAARLTDYLWEATMGTRSNGEWKTRFPGFEFKVGEAYAPSWTRVYPPDCDVRDRNDHLAVASGAYGRYETWGEWAFERGRLTAYGWVADAAGDRWREDLSAVAFDDVDVAYLDWVLGQPARPGSLTAHVQGLIAAYANGAGAWRFAGDSVWEGGQVFDEGQLREVGWMYANLATFLEYQARRDTSETGTDRSRSGYDDPADEGKSWDVAIRSWGSEPWDWTRERKGHWAQLVAAAGELRDVYTRVVEMGPDCVPDGGDEEGDLGPVAWVNDRVSRVVEALPATGGDRAKWEMVALVVRTGEACRDAVGRVYRDPGPCRDVLEDELVDLIRRAREHFPVRRVKGVRRLLTGTGLTLDVALCGGGD